MRLTRLIPLITMLGLVLVYDPDHSTAQFGKRDGGGAPGGFTPGGGGPGGPPGGFGKGGGGFKMDPEQGWAMMVRATQSTGDTIDLSKISPQMREFSRSRAERDGSIPLPESGLMSKSQYFDHFARSEAAKAAKAAAGGAPAPGGAMVMNVAPAGPMPGGPTNFSMPPGGPGGFPGGFSGRGGPPGGPGGFNPEERAAQRLKEQDKDGDGRISFDEADGRLKENFAEIDKNGDRYIDLEEYKAYYVTRSGGGGPGGPGGNWNGGNPGDPNGGNGGGRRDEKKDTQEVKPVAMRYGHLPKDLPDWFDKYDGDKDGQVALHEWRRAGEDIAKFQEMDLNGDGLITADELLRYNMKQTEDAKIAVLNGEAGAFSRPSFAGNSRGSGGFSLPGSTPSDKGSEKVSATTDKSEKGDRSSDKMNSSRGSEKDKGSSGSTGSSDKPNPFRDGGFRKGKN